MTDKLVQQARAIYNTRHWSAGYFDIASNGEAAVLTRQGDISSAISLPSLVKEVEARGLSLPVLIRFAHILHDRVDTLCGAFQKAITENEYNNSYTAVYPIKVNQQRAVVEELVKHGGGERFGLEAGSKPELMAVLGMPMPKGSKVVCNGYKDREYIRLALIGEKLGRHVYIVVEKLNELNLILEEAEKLNVTPRIGVRVRLMSMGKGKWQNTGGEKSKFGLSGAQVLDIVDRLKQSGRLDCLQLLHFHLGSQIANIRDIQRGMRECARYFVELHKLEANIRVVDVGGGLGVDYEGTQSRSYSSMNYSVQEYANNVVHALKEVCAEAEIPHPHIITESGRALTAHHALLVMNVIDNERAPNIPDFPAISDDEPKVLQELWVTYNNLTARSVLEAYHDNSYLLSEAQSLYVHGVLSLPEWARAEQLYYTTCHEIRKLLDVSSRAHQEILNDLNEKLADKLFCNFSLFQSLPDAWGIDQVFPVMPLARLNEPTEARAVLQDVTCDSDGRIEHYVDETDVEATLPMPYFKEDERNLIGIFMVGAYQEILGDMHNLFGDTDSVMVEAQADGSYTLTQCEEGDTIADVLRYVHFEPDTLLRSYQEQIMTSEISVAEKKQCLDYLRAGLSGYTYLEE